MLNSNLDKKEREVERELSFTRIYDAPCELVWKAWTNPEQIVKWWGPDGFTTTTSKMEVKPGGVWRFVMHGPDGRDYQNLITYHEVVEHECLVYSYGDVVEKGLEPIRFELTVTFERQEGKTKLTMRSLFPTVKQRDWVIKEYKADEGASQTLARLSGHLAKEPFVMGRTFNAPVAAVWNAITDKEQMNKWYFGNLESFKPEPGFQTQFNVHHNDKNYLHIWKVTDVVPGKKITYSWKYANSPGESFVTFELFDEGNKTRLELTHAGLETFLPENNPDYSKANFVEGWTALIGSSLKEFLEKPQLFKETKMTKNNPEFTIDRTFDAPRELMWKAWTTPELMAKWWGPKGVSIGRYTMDFRVGGIYHYSMKSPDGSVMWGKFVYSEIVNQEKIVFVSSFSDEQGNITRHPFSQNWPLEMLSTITFSGQEGKTRVAVHWVPLNATDEERKAVADAMAGMQQGWTGTFERLEEFLARAKSEAA